MDNDLDALRGSINLLNVISGEFKKVADTCGGEWAGACPLCGGKDRFRIQPFFEGGRWWCRGCGDGRWHDVFAYLMKKENITFPEAVQRAKNLTGIANKPPDQPEPFDRDVWQSRARAFIQECDKNLTKPNNTIILEWLHNRGLHDETLELFHIGLNPTTVYIPAKEWGGTGKDICLPAGVVIPCVDNQVHYIKIRRIPHDKGSKYHLVRGSQGWLFGGKTCADALTAILYESELDALLGWQHLPGVGHVSLPAGQSMKDIYLPILGNVQDVIIAYDNDEPGQTAADELGKIKHFYKADRLPHGKDLTDYFIGGGDVVEYLYSNIGKIPGDSMNG